MSDHIDARFDEFAVALDQCYLIIMSAVVIFMQGGFAALEMGTARVQNSASILMKNLADVFYSSVSFYLLGFSLAFSCDEKVNNTFIGIGSYNPEREMDYAFLFFQMAFASTSATIVSGGMLERTRHEAYNVWTVIITTLIYAPVVHWIWSSTGWLSAANTDPLLGRPLNDFAGAGAVHLVGGVAALIGAYMVGPRLGFFDDDGKPQVVPGHSMQLTGIGAFILWFGFFAFNAGSTLAVSNGAYKVAGRIAVNTALSGASAGLVANIISIFGSEHFVGVGDIINCVLTGLVAITAPCNAVTPLEAMLIGSFSTVFFLLADRFVRNRLLVDDPLCAFAVHGSGGMWGLISTGLFAYSKDGQASLLHGGDFHQFGVQLFGLCFITIWTSATSFAAFSLIDRTIGLRVSDREQADGLDAQIGVKQNCELLNFQEVMFESNGLEQLLSKPQDPMLLQFRDFLSNEFASEQLDFMLDVNEFRAFYHSKIRKYGGTRTHRSKNTTLWSHVGSVGRSRRGSRTGFDDLHLGMENTPGETTTNEDGEMRRARAIQQVREKGKELFNHYIKVGTENEVNVSMRSKDLVEKFLAEDQPIELLMSAFSQCYLEAMQMLKGDSWRRFIADMKERRFENEEGGADTDPNQKKSLRKRLSTMKFGFDFAQRVKRR